MPKGDTALLFCILRENILLVNPDNERWAFCSSSNADCYFFPLVHSLTEGIIFWGSQTHRGFRFSSLCYMGSINALLSSYNVPHWTLKSKTYSSQNQSPFFLVTCKIISKGQLICLSSDFHFSSDFYTQEFLYSEIKHTFKRMCVIFSVVFGGEGFSSNVLCFSRRPKHYHH